MLPFRRRAQITGSVDGMQDSAIVGWAADQQALDDILEVAILVDNQLVAEGKADLFRPDLVAAGIGHGRHGFRIPVSSLASSLISMTVKARKTNGRACDETITISNVMRRQIARSQCAGLEEIHPPETILKICREVADGSFASQGSATDAELVYMSDELFTKTLLAAGKTIRT